MTITSIGVRAAVAVLVITFAFAGREAETARAAVIQVSSTADSGAGTLRAAILDANATPAPDVITFNLGPGVRVIAPLTLLPTITEPLTIDGYCSTCGATPNTAAFGQAMNTNLKIVLSGANIDLPGFEEVGLTFAGANTATDGSVVQGLVFRDWKETGILLIESSPTAMPYVVRGNIIGSDETGATATGGRFGVYFAGGTTGKAIIGGSTAADRNLISGHSVSGIQLGAGVNHVITGNYLGSKLNGNEAMLPPSADGSNIVLTSVSGVTIGGLLPEERNLISGAPGTGIHTATASNTTIINNLVGTNATGTAAMGNLYGMSLGNSTDTSVGTMTAGSGNLISGNRQGGMIIGSGGEKTVLRNLIGTNAAGTAAIPNGQSGFGIYTNFTGGLVVIGAPGAGNTIANERVGIEVQIGSEVLIAGNTIGLPGMPNEDAGIEVTDTIAQIGSVAEADKNIISNNSGPGILVRGTAAATIGANQIEDNAGLPIDIAPEGQNVNDTGDADTGPNDLLNHPVITRALATATNLHVEIDLALPANIQAEVYLYTGGSCGSGISQLETFRGALPVAIGPSGDVELTADLTTVVVPGSYLTAVVTDLTNGVTSEASICLEVRHTSDANCDGAIDATDALVVMRKLAGFTTNIPVACDGQIVPAGDANAGGTVDMSDVLYIRRLVAILLN